VSGRAPRGPNRWQAQPRLDCVKQLIEEVLSLPVVDRVAVVDSILRNLNSPESDIDHKWAAVAQKRLGELKSGEVRAAAAQECS